MVKENSLNARKIKIGNCTVNINMKMEAGVKANMITLILIGGKVDCLVFLFVYKFT